MSSPIVVRELEAGDDPSHIAFLDRLALTSPSVLAYHYPFHRELLVTADMGEPAYFGAWSGEEMVGLLPGFLRSGKYGTVYSSMPYFGPTAGVLCAHDENRAAIHEALIEAALSKLHDSGDAISASFYTPLFFDDFEIYDSILPDAAVVDKFTQYIELDRFQPNRSIRYDIRKALNNGVIVTDEIAPDILDTFYEIYKQNCLDNRIPLKQKKVIEYLLNASAREKYVRSYFAYRDERMIGGLIFLLSPSTASYWVPGSLHNERSNQPGTALLDHGIREAQSLGLHFWNWESSPSRESGVYAFKKKWGSTERSYRIYVVSFEGLDRMRALGQKEIETHYPFYFVYPFDRL